MNLIGKFKTDVVYKIEQNRKTYNWFYNNYDINQNLLYKGIRFIRPFWYSVFHSENFHNIKKRFIDNDKVYTFDYIGGGEVQPIHIHFYLPYAIPDRDCIQYYILRTGHFFEERYLEFIKEKYIHPGMTILDCGANIGNHSVYFSKICKAQKVIAFEAVQSTFQILKKNVNLNGIENIVDIHNNALGDRARMVSMDVETTENIGGAHVVENKDGAVEMVALDDTVEEKVDFIKIDVEGYEYNVLLGARKLISRYKPIIMIEIWDSNYEKVNILLDGMGYHGEKHSMADYIYTYKKSCNIQLCNSNR